MRLSFQAQWIPRLSERTQFSAGRFLPDGGKMLEEITQAVGGNRVSGATCTVRIPGFADESGSRIKIKALWAAAALVSGATSPTAAASVPSFLDQGVGQVAIISREQKRSPFSGKLALTEIRRRTALTWDQLAMLMSVSRRTIHTWAAGGTMRPSHKAKLEELYERVLALRDLKSFAIRKLVLDEADMAGEKLAADSRIPTGESAILTSSVMQLEAGVPINRQAKTKIIRKS